MNNEVRIPRDSSFKVLLLGDAGTGKTTFVSRFIKETSPLKWVPNISFEIHALRFDTAAHGKITLNVWDTGTFASLLPLFLSPPVASFFISSSPALP